MTGIKLKYHINCCSPDVLLALSQLLIYLAAFLRECQEPSRAAFHFIVYHFERKLNSCYRKSARLFLFIWHFYSFSF